MGKDGNLQATYADAMRHHPFGFALGGFKVKLARI
jgi:hypothetical protein